jgi:DNA-binding NarL/FixJ family response regulator
MYKLPDASSSRRASFRRRGMPDALQSGPWPFRGDGMTAAIPGFGKRQVRTEPFPVMEATMALSTAVSTRVTARLSSSDRNATAPESVRTRALLLVIERDREPEILAAIRAAHGNAISLHPAAVESRVRPASPRGTWLAPPEALTRREIDVLRLLAKGNTNRQAAHLLGLSVRTVENHRANLLAKLGVVSRAEIVSYASEYDLV